MPFVSVRITRDGATREQKARVISEMTQALQRVLGKEPGLTHVVIEEIDTDNWGVAGESATVLRTHGRGVMHGLPPSPTSRVDAVDDHGEVAASWGSACGPTSRGSRELSPASGASMEAWMPWRHSGQVDAWPAESAPAC